MSWFRIDDQFYDHPKVKAIPRRDRGPAVGLWTLAGTWASKHPTDGHVPAAVVADLGTPRLADVLVKCGLWEYAEDGYQFHDWLDHQPSAAQIAARRDADRKRQQRGRDRQRQPPAVTP